MRIIIITLFITISSLVNAQQLPLLAQYRENHLLLNPASVSINYVNNNSSLSLGTLGRYQWVGLPDAPKTETVFGSYFFEDQNIGFGGYVVNDQTGAFGFTGAYGQFSYLLDLTRSGHKLAFGINGGMVQYRANLNRINFRDAFDPSTADRIHSKLFPDFGFGMYYLYDKFFYAGFSVPQIFGLNLQYRTPDGDFDIKRLQHGYVHAGGFLGIGEESFIEPSIWLQMSPNSPFNLNTNIRALLAVGYNFELWFGGGYSTSGIVHVESGFNLTDLRWFGAYDGLKVGFSYDYSVANYSLHFTSAYEVHIGYYIDI